jgi:signal transduction histidine kinase
MTERMWRVAALFRVITMIYAAILIIHDHDQYGHPVGGIAALAVIIGWTAIAVTAYSRPAGRSRWMIAIDVAVAVVLVLSTRWIDSPARITAGMPTIPSFWAASPVLACSVAGGPWAGLAGALAIAGADLLERPQLSMENPFSNIVLLLIAGGIGGYIVRLGVQAEETVARVSRTEAAIAERDRLARSIHDSVLQVLTLVSRRGQALGGEAAELGELAAEQESSLRRLISSSTPGYGNGSHRADGTGPADLRAVLERLADPHVIVSCPATAVLLPAAVADALAGATAAALDNVRQHAGPQANAWVLVEDEGTVVRVSVRDDGSGFEAGRLAQAAAAGRLGVSQSIVGRIRAAGGTACVTSSPGQGTEVELAIPRT